MLIRKLISGIVGIVLLHALGVASLMGEDGTTESAIVVDSGAPVDAPSATRSKGIANSADAVDFHREVLPILARRCALCHSGERTEGGFSVATRADFLKGGDSGPGAVVGKSGESLAIELVSGANEDRIMPAKGARLSKEQVKLLSDWIDQGMPWDADVSLTTSSGLASLAPRHPQLPESQTQSANPIDRLLAPYFAKHGISAGELVTDRIYARRVYRDLLGLLPSPEQLARFEHDSRPEKRALLVQELLDDRTQYALHWLTFWNDLLRNSYRGTGFIDKNRSQITAWLYAALYDNKPYDQFVRELVSPNKTSSGFVKGIVWRGVVNASQRPEMQAAQSVGQVFLGINLKCASCHDSFVDPWKLSDAYNLAAVFAEERLEIHHCDKPTGKAATPAFLFSQLGTLNAEANATERQAELARLITSPENGRLTRTMVNRLWERFFGRGIIANVDGLDEEPFDADLLDWLASDFAEHGYDLKHTMELICTSRAYQMQAVPMTAQGKVETFRGPLVRRMSAEQFVDALSQLTDVWQTETPAMSKADKRGQGGQLKAIKGVLAKRKAPTSDVPLLRAAIVDADALMTSLGRPNREQVVSRRETVPTPLESLEFTNGAVLDGILKEGAGQWLARSLPPSELVDNLYLRALGRKPNANEQLVAQELIGTPPTAEGIQDVLWTIIMLPEFQFID